MQALSSALVVAIGMMLLVAAPASATAPDESPTSSSFSVSADCGSFTDDYAGTVTIRTTTFFDSGRQPDHGSWQGLATRDGYELRDRHQRSREGLIHRVG
jgi:hypothetical protein